MRKFPLDLPLSLWIFIAFGRPIVSGSGNGGGGSLVAFPETDSLKGQGVALPWATGTFSVRWGIRHSEVGLGRTWELFPQGQRPRPGLQHSSLGICSSLSLTLVSYSESQSLLFFHNFVREIARNVNLSRVSRLGTVVQP